MSLNENSLGKSLSNVFAKTKRQESVGNGSREVPLGLLRPTSDNPRKSFDDKSLDDLAASIREHGVLQPLIVMERDGGFEILAGERRYRACQRAGLHSVPVVIKSGVDAAEVAQLRLIENIQREDLNPIELGEAYARLLEEHSLTQEVLAGRLGISRSQLANSLRLLQLPELVREHLAAGKISMGHAKCLATAPEALAVQLAERCSREQLSVRQLEALLKQQAECEETGAKGLDKTRSSRSSTVPPHIRELEANLARLFNAKVTVSERGGKGRLTIDFHSKAHFKSVVEELDTAFERTKRSK